MHTVTFKYLNHNGKLAERTVDVTSLDYIENPGLGYQSDWFITGHCHTKRATHSFALNRIVFDNNETLGKVKVMRVMTL